MKIFTKKTEETRAAPEGHTLGGELSFAAAEAYKLLRTNILFALPDENKCRIIGVTSSCSGEGKSTTTLNLAYMLAEAGEWVLIIDADMRLPTIARRLKIRNAPGLSNLLAGLHTPEDVNICASGIQDQVRVLPAGNIPPNPSELLGTKRMQEALLEFSKDFDFILLDLPPLTAVSDALVISSLVDGMIIVVRQDYASRRAVKETVQQLTFAKTRILGFVMTCTENQGKKGKYGKYRGYKYGYGYGYGYGRKPKKKSASKAKNRKTENAKEKESANEASSAKKK